MRGGAIVLLAWAGLLGVLMGLHAIWTHGGGIQIYEWGFALLAIVVCAASAVARNRTALRRGPPPPPPPGQVQIVPDLSFGAMLAGIAIALSLFGQVFGNALTYTGFGLLALALGRLIQEKLAARRSARELRERVAAVRGSGEPPVAGAVRSAQEPEHR